MTALDTRPMTSRSGETWEIRQSRLPDLVTRLGARLLVTLGAVFLAAPLIVIVITSFNVAPALDFPPRRWSFSSYQQISAQLYHSFLVSMELAAIGTAVSLVLAIPCAFALVRGRLPGRRAAEAMFRGPLQVPQIVMGLALFQFYVLTRNQLGLPLSTSLWGLVIAHVVLITPYALAACVARISALDLELEEAATSLGARATVVFLRVTLPTIRQSVISSALLAFLVSFDNVPLSLFLTSPGSTTLPVALFNESESSLSSVVYAAAALTVAFSLLVTVALDRMVGLRAALKK
jgi:putative spermidine/putrescine transport system permease protein